MELQWNLSNPTHQGTREMCRIVQCRNTQVLFNKKVTFQYRWLFNRGGCMGRFGYIVHTTCSFSLLLSTHVVFKILERQKWKSSKSIQCTCIQILRSTFLAKFEENWSRQCRVSTWHENTGCITVCWNMLFHKTVL
jgi:hypothetical protein